mgnify:CR=1 FL=1
MADPNQSQKSNELDRHEHIQKGARSAKAVALFRYNSDQDSLNPFGGLTPNEDYDYIDVQQTSATVETYVYKDGGSGGTTVLTIVVTYVDSTKADIDHVAFS